MKARIIFQRIAKKRKQKTGRILVFTGARQTGKTATTSYCFSDYPYLSIEDPVKRKTYSSLTAEQWKQHYPKAVLDEVQKEPKLIESIKAVYDQYDQPRYILLGSSQLLLLEKVKESLAGRCTIFEVFPLTLPELLTHSFEEEIKDSFLIQFLKKKAQPENLLPNFTLDKNYAQKMSAYNFYLQYGGYPILTHDEISNEEKREWLTNYVKTYLERDVRDLANFRDLDPFVQLQHYLASLTGNVLNYSSISKEIGVSVPTVKRYVEYMRLSYQTITLKAWHKNSLKQLTKAPKVHFMDYGVLQAVLQKVGPPSGNEFESIIVSEIFKQIHSYQLPIKMWHLRTKDGRELDLLLETEEAFIPIEIKQKRNIRKADTRNFRNLDQILDKPIRKGFILSNDPEIKVFDGGITAMHAGQFLCG